jgi:hypothetical protein
MGFLEGVAVPASKVVSEYTHPFGFPDVPDVYKKRHGLLADRVVCFPIWGSELRSSEWSPDVRLYNVGNGVDESKQISDGDGISLETSSALPRPTLPGWNTIAVGFECSKITWSSAGVISALSGMKVALTR